MKKLIPIPDFDRYLLNIETKEVFRVNLPQALYLKDSVVRRVKLKPVRPSYGFGGLRVQLWKDGVPKCLYLHHIVARCNVPNPKGKPFVRRLDGDPFNLSPSNLKWVGCPAGY